MDFADFYRATAPRTLRYAYGLTGDLPQAQDVVQEAYVRAWQRWRRVSGYDDTEAWLRLVITRLVFDWWRRLGVHRRTQLEQRGEVAPPSENTVLLTTALRALPPAQRRALAMHYFLDLPIAQIAAETGASEGTVKSWLSRGRAGLAEALRERAETVDLPEAQAIADSGRRRRRTRKALAAGLAVLALVVTAVGLLRHGRAETRPPQPAGPPSASPLAFNRLAKVGSAVPMPAGAFGIAGIVNGHGYVGWRGANGRLQVGAVDLATGAPLWPVQTLPGAFGDWNGLIALPNAVISIGEHDDGTVPDKTMFALDPATGKLRWQRGMDVNGYDILAYRDVLVLANHDAKTTIALDWVTGQQRWRIDGPISEVMGMHTADDQGSTAGERSDGFDALLTGDTLLRLDPTGNLIEYSVTTGQPTGRNWSGVPTGDSDVTHLAYEGSLYTTADTELSKLDLNAGRTALLYHGSGALNSAIPCDTDAMCVLEGDSNRTDLVKLRGGHEVQRVRVDGAESVIPVGLSVLVRGSGRNADRWTELYGQSGQQLYKASPDSTVYRIDPANLLELGSTDLYGLTVPDVKRFHLGSVALGQGLPAMDGGTLLLCTDKGWQVYRMT